MNFIYLELMGVGITSILHFDIIKLFFAFSASHLDGVTTLIFFQLI